MARRYYPRASSVLTKDLSKSRSPPLGGPLFPHVLVFRGFDTVEDEVPRAGPKTERRCLWPQTVHRHRPPSLGIGTRTMGRQVSRNNNASSPVAYRIPPVTMAPGSFFVLFPLPLEARSRSRRPCRSLSRVCYPCCHWPAFQSRAILPCGLPILTGLCQTALTPVLRYSREDDQSSNKLSGEIRECVADKWYRQLNRYISVRFCSTEPPGRRYEIWNISRSRAETWHPQGTLEGDMTRLDRGEGQFRIKAWK